jgi:hypothetical protein
MKKSASAGLTKALGKMLSAVAIDVTVDTLDEARVAGAHPLHSPEERSLDCRNDSLVVLRANQKLACRGDCQFRMAGR